MQRFIPAALVLLLPLTAFALPKPPLADPLPYPNTFDPTPWPPGGGGGGVPALYANPASIASRVIDGMDLRWSNSSAALQGLAIQRALGRDGTFSTIRCWDTAGTTVGQFAKGGVAPTGDCIPSAHPGAFTDSGLSSDTLYCYRIRVWDNQGTRVDSSPVCGYTTGTGGKGGPSAVQPWQAQLIITTGSVDNAGTDADVRIGLNDHMSNISPHGNETWLDYPHDDFERDSTFVYDLDLGTLAERHDITKLSVFTVGNDAWCVERLDLVVDRSTVFSREFSDQPDGCLWLGTDENVDSDNLFEVSHDELRLSPDWIGFFDSPPPNPIANADLVSRIESAVGNIAHSTDLYWSDGDGATVGFVDDDTFHVDVAVTASANNWFDPTVRLEFDVDVVVQCVPAGGDFDVTLDLLSTNPHVYAEGWLSEVGEFFACSVEWDWNCLEEELASTVEQRLPSLPSGSLTLPFCPVVTVTQAGDLAFSA